MSDIHSLENFHITCERHIQPFIPRWPIGFAPFAQNLMSYIPSLGRWKSAIEVKEALSEQPLCCRLDVGRLFITYGLAHLTQPFWISGKCELCEVVGPGTGFLTITDHKPLKRWSHLCTRCFYFDFDLLECSGMTVPKDPWGWWNDDISRRTPRV